MSSFARIAPHLLWKEYRVLRGLWIGVGLLGLLFLMLHRMVSSSDTPALAAVVWLIPCCFLLGCLASEFAGEREDRTNLWLQSVGAPVFPVVFSKLAFAAVAATLMVVCLFGASLLVCKTTVDDLLSEMFQMNPMVCVEFFIFSWLASVICRSVLNAVGLSAAFLVLFNIFLPPTDIAGTQLFARLMVLILAAMASVVLVGRWARPAEAFISAVRPLHRRSAKPRKKVAADRREPVKPWCRAWQRLIWLEFRQLRSCLLPFTCALLIVSFGAPREFLAMRFVALFATAFLAGIMAFRTGQDRLQYRFFGHHGFTPELVWASRLSFWLIAGTLGCLAVIIVHAVVRGFSQTPNYAPQQDLTDPLTLLLVFAIGQAASLLAQRSVTAIAFGLIVAIVAGCWNQLMYLTDVPRWWSVGLVVVAAFVLTWQLTSDWLIERWGRRTAWKFVRVTVLPGIVLLVMVAGFRMLEIPLAAGSVHYPSNAAERPLRPEDRRRRDEIRQLMSSISFPPETRLAMQDYLSGELPKLSDEAIRTGLEENRDELAELRRLLDIDDARFASVLSVTEASRAEFTPEFDSLLMLRTAELESQDRLDQALDVYLDGLKAYRFFANGGGMADRSWQSADQAQQRILQQLVVWMFHPKQTEEKLRRGLARIDEELDRFPKAHDAVVRDYAYYVHELIDNVADRPWGRGGPYPVTPEYILAHWFPWERVRLRTVFAVEAANREAFVRHLERALNQRHQPVIQQFVEGQGFSFSHVNPVKMARWTRGIPLLNQSAASLAVPIIDRVARIRATRTVGLMALYRLRHGSLPDDLTDLIDAETPLVTITDPWTDRPFEYVPHGYARFHANGLSLQLKPNTPLVYSPGRYGVHFEPLSVTSDSGRTIFWSPVNTRRAGAAVDRLPTLLIEIPPLDPDA